ncbi:MAG: ABC transporter permease [Desulfurellaceae bacterium]|nr:ABC transporter permease [Desulfurellaceae bacterium]
MTVLRTFGRAPLSARLGLGLIAVYLGAALLAPLLAPYGETEVVGDVWEVSSRSALLGTDQLGRDLLSRLLYGARNTVGVALVATLLAFGVGVVGGSAAALIGGWVDSLLNWLVEVLLALPSLIFALLLLSVLSPSVTTVVLVSALLSATRVFRLSRALALDMTVVEFVELARLRGEGWWWVVRSEIVPNTYGPLLAELGLRFCFVFLFISSLSFLGLGMQPPTADWGSMVRDNAGAMPFGLAAPFFPAAAIGLLTIAVNLVVDWLAQTEAAPDRRP